MFSSGIGQATGLGTTSSVATSAPQNTAEQALSGIAITHGSMDKAFDLKPCDFLDPADLRKAQLSGGNYTTGPLFLQKSCPILPCNGHLSASMEFHPGKMFSEICKHSHVLDNHPIQSGPVIGQYIFIQSGKFRFFYQCVYRQIYFSLKKMSIPDAGNQFFFRKIFRISSGPETAATQIYSIRTGMDSPVKGFRISGRCQ